jgi:hypothetical protein
MAGAPSTAQPPSQARAARPLALRKALQNRALAGRLKRRGRDALAGRAREGRLAAARGAPRRRPRFYRSFAAKDAGSEPSVTRGPWAEFAVVIFLILNEK